MAALGWIITAAQARRMSDMSGMAMGPMSLAPLLAVWTVMMVAMMFPSVAPMLTLISIVSRNNRAAGRRPAPVWVFLIGYLTVWGAFGVPAYLLSLAIPAAGMAGPGLRTFSPLMGGLVLMAAGLYQWTPLKRMCLQHCRSPFAFVMHGWRDGYIGAFTLAARHGAYCVGCCWALMIVLFAVGLMNLEWMALLAAVVFVEKVVPWGPWAGKLTGAVLAWYGAAILVVAVSHPS
jgi:predicted metal-binding membrane protein